METLLHKAEVARTQFDFNLEVAKHVDTLAERIAKLEAIPVAAPAPPVKRARHKYFSAEGVAAQALEDAADFITSIGAERLIAVSQNETRNSYFGGITVWYWE